MSTIKRVGQTAGASTLAIATVLSGLSFGSAAVASPAGSASGARGTNATVTISNPVSAPVGNNRPAGWPYAAKESGGTWLECPGDSAMTGRQHGYDTRNNGGNSYAHDENAPSWIRCGVVAINGQRVQVGETRTSQLTSKGSNWFGTFKYECPTIGGHSSFLTGRYHKGDNEADDPGEGTMWKCSTLHVGGKYLEAVAGSSWTTSRMAENGKFDWPNHDFPNTVAANSHGANHAEGKQFQRSEVEGALLAGEYHQGDEEGPVRYKVASLTTEQSAEGLDHVTQPAVTLAGKGKATDFPIVTRSTSDFSNPNATVTLTAPAGTSFTTGQSSIAGAWSSNGTTWTAYQGHGLSNVRYSNGNRTITASWNGAMTLRKGEYNRWMPRVQSDSDTAGGSVVRYQVDGNASNDTVRLGVDGYNEVRWTAAVQDGLAHVTQPAVTLPDKGKATDFPIVTRSTSDFSNPNATVTLTAPAGTSFTTGQSSIAGAWSSNGTTWIPYTGHELTNVRYSNGNRTITAAWNGAMTLRKGEYNRWLPKVQSDSDTAGAANLSYSVDGTASTGGVRLQTSGAYAVNWQGVTDGLEFVAGTAVALPGKADGTKTVPIVARAKADLQNPDATVTLTAPEGTIFVGGQTSIPGAKSSNGTSWLPYPAHGLTNIRYSDGGRTITGSWNGSMSLAKGEYNRWTPEMATESTTAGSGALSVAATGTAGPGRVEIAMNGSQPLTWAAQDITKPTAPRDFTATRNDKGEVMVGWREPESDGGSPITGYIVHVDGDLHSTGPERTRNIGKLDGALMHDVTIKATNGKYTSASLIGYVEATFEAPTITALTSKPNTKVVDIEWKVQDPEVVKSFDVVRDGVTIATGLAPDTTTGVFSDHEFGKTYEYTVVAHSKNGKTLTSEPKSVEVTEENVAPAPAAPTIASLTQIDETESVRIDWTGDTANVDEFQVFRGDDKVATTDAKGTSATIDGHDYGVPYEYRVVAVGTGGETSSERESVTLRRSVLDAADLPKVELDRARATEVRMGIAADGQDLIENIDATFTMTAPEGTRFIAGQTELAGQRCSLDDCSWTDGPKSIAMKNVVVASDGRTLTGTVENRDADLKRESWSWLPKVTVQDDAAAGEAKLAWSMTAATNWGEQKVDGATVVTIDAVNEAPVMEDVWADLPEDTHDTVRVQFEASDADGTIEQFELKEFLGKDEIQAATAPGDAFEYEFRGERELGSTYTYAVRAVDDKGAKSEWMTADRTIVDVERPDFGADAKLWGENATPNSVDVVWDSAKDNVGVREYTLSVNGGAPITGIKHVDGAKTQRHTITGLSPDQTYRIEVRAFDSEGNRSSGLTGDVRTAAQPSIPGVPADVQVAFRNDFVPNAWEITWQANGAEHAKQWEFRLRKGPSTGPVGEPIKTWRADPNRDGSLKNADLTDGELDRGTSYWVDVRAVYEGGETAWSAPRNFTSSAK